jgi:hypothetical protein
MSKLLRLALATITAPIAGAITTWVLFLLFESTQAGFSTFHTSLLVHALGVLMALYFAFPAMILIGLPAHAVLSAMNSRYVLGYAICGVVPGIVLAALYHYGGAAFPDFQTLALGGMLGGSTAIYFWLLRRPDRDAANPTTPAP